MTKPFLIFLFVCIARFCCSQPIENVVFEGAGIRGVAYVGALKVLEQKNMLMPVRKVGGTSAGAIAALAVALNYNIGEIEQIMYNTKLQKFNDGKFFFIGGLSRINRNYGWYRGKAFLKWLEKLIEQKTGDKDITFRGLHDHGFKDLYVTGTSLNNQKLIVFSKENYPDMKIKDAVRISMSIPLYFEALMIDSAGNVLGKRNKHTNYDLMVDGGFTGNFPISIFDSLSYDQHRIPHRQTLGLRIDTPEQIAYDASEKGLSPIPINHFRNYLAAFYNYVIENLNRNSLTNEDWQRTVSISSGHIGPKIRRLSISEKNLLMKNGEDAMLEYLSK